MTWTTLGRPHYFGRNRDRWKQRYDKQYGPDGWRIRHLVCGELMELAVAARHCGDAYAAFLSARRDFLDWLCTPAAAVYLTATSNVRSGFDYTIQETKVEHVHDIALRNAIAQLGGQFRGEKLLRIGGRGQESLPLSPGLVPFHRPEWIVQPALEHWWRTDSIECFWQSNKVLQVQTR